jgi:phage I-like protein
MPLALLAAAALALDGSTVPDWIRFVPAGDFRAVDGRGPWRIADPAAVIAASLAALPLPLDENHATDHAQKNGGAAPARGWIAALEARDDGLWGRVEWTDTGRALLAERAYRAVSPVIEHTKDGRVLRLVRAALTNTPAVPGLSLLTEEDPTVDLSQLRAALGLPETADEAAILTGARAASEAQRAQTALLTRIAGAAGLGADATPDAIVTTLTARAAAGDPAALAQRVVTLETQLTTLTRQTARTQAETLVDDAIRAGKPIRALRDHYVDRATGDHAAVATELAALVSVNAGGVVSPPPTDGAAQVVGEEARIVALLGVDPAKYAEQRKTLGFTEAR